MDTFINIIIYHNENCSKSREVIKLLKDRGIEPHIIEYLKTPPSAKLLINLSEQAGVNLTDWVREDTAKASNIDFMSLEPVKLAELISAEPKLLNRPLVVVGTKIGICRPPALVLEWLDKE